MNSNPSTNSRKQGKSSLQAVLWRAGQVITILTLLAVLVAGNITSATATSEPLAAQPLRPIIGNDVTSQSNVPVHAIGFNPRSLLDINPALTKPGSIDTNFNYGAGLRGTNQFVYAVVVQEDGKVIVGGSFTGYDGGGAPDGILRLNTDGSPDTSFNNGGTGIGGLGATVRALAIDADGKILVGGNFNTYNGVSVPSGIIRLNDDGTLDSGFNNGGAGIGGGNTSDMVHAIAVQSDDKIVIGGDFKSYNGETAAPDFVMRLNTDGTRDTTGFITGDNTGVVNTVYPACGFPIVYALAMQPDDKTLVGGDCFNAYSNDGVTNDTQAPDILLRLNTDGTVDTTFNHGAGSHGLEAAVYAIVVQPSDGKIVVGGKFTQYNADPAAPDDILRVNTNGSLDTTGFIYAANSGVINTVTPANDVVYSLALQPDGKIVAGGEQFDAYSNTGASNDTDAPDNLLRLNTDGTLDVVFNYTGAGPNGAVRALGLQPLAPDPLDTKIWLGGTMTSYNADGQAPDGIERITFKGDSETTIDSDSPEPSVVGETVTVDYTVFVGIGTPTGDVTVSDGVDSCTASAATGTCNITFSSVGAKTLTATYEGDDNFFGSDSATESHTVNQASTTTTITSDLPDPSGTGQAVAVNYSVAVTAPGGGTPTGNVTVSDGVDSCIGTVAAGTCNITFTSIGAKNITATYAGNSNYTGSASSAVSHIVNKGTPVITWSNPANITFGTALSGTQLNASASVPGAYTYTPPAGTVLSVGNGQNLHVDFVPTDTTNYNSTSADVSINVLVAGSTTTITSDSPDPSVVGQSVAVNYTVTSTGGTPTGNVTVSDGVDSCIGTVAAGSCNITFTSAGTKTLTATYAGDSSFDGSTSANVSHTVNKASTTTSITSDSPDSSVVGQSVTVNFSVAVTAPGSGTPTGDVTVSDGVDSCMGTVAAGTCNITFTSAGSKTLTATYAGDSNFNGSTSADESHTVNKASTTTTITSDTPDPSLDGATFTVNFSVAVTAPGSGTPTGNVTVSDGVEDCTGTVAAGSCDLTLNTTGARTLTATYAGDSNFNGSTSANESHTVDAIPEVSSIDRSGTTPTNATSVDFTVTFSESITGGGTSNFSVTATGSVTGASVTNVSAGPGTTRTVTVNTGTGDGTVRLDMANSTGMTDSTGNAINNLPFTSGQAYTIDKTAPTVSITSTATDPTNVSPIPVTITFNESVSNFVDGDITVGNGTKSNFAGSGTTYTVDVTPSANGTVTVDVAAGVANDSAGNGNQIASQFSIEYDTDGPEVTVEQAIGQDDPTGVHPINFTVTFSKTISLPTFTNADVVLGGTAGPTVAEITEIAPNDGTTFNVAVTEMTNSGTVTASLGFGAVTDTLGNLSETSTSVDNTVTFNKPPTPGTPSLLSPASNALITDYTPLLDWNDATAALTYELQVATDAGFTALVHDETGLAVSEFQIPTDLASNTNYYWRVRSVNGVDVKSNWASRTFRTALTPPAVVSPADGFASLELRPPFDWADDANANGYMIQISTTTDFKRPILKGTVKTSYYVPTKDLPKGATLYWRVQSKPAKGANGPSDWSAVRAFTTPVNPPPATSLLSPKNNALTTDYTPLLTWNPVVMPEVDFQNYIIQVDDDPLFGSPAVNDSSITNLNTVQFEPATDLNPNTKYYWRVRSVKTDNELSNWSTKLLYFRTALTPPTLVSPVDGFDSLELRPPFDWADDVNSNGYTIEISLDNAFTQVVHKGNAKTSNYVPTKDLPKDATLYWRVQTKPAKGSNGPSGWSEVRSFTTPVNPPPATSLLSPTNNALSTNYTPDFTWNPVVMPAVDFQNYIIQVDDDPSFGSPAVNDSSITDLNTTEFEPASDLDPNTKYYWRVRSVKTDGELSNWSMVLYFRTAILPPTLLTPLDTSAAGTLMPTLDWDDVAGASGYNIQISTDPTFATTIVKATTVTSTYTLLKNLPGGDTIYWRVQAKPVKGANGPSDWSDVFSFTTP